MAAIVATAKAAAIVNPAPSKRLPSDFFAISMLIQTSNLKSSEIRFGELPDWLGWVLKIDYQATVFEIVLLQILNARTRSLTGSGVVDRNQFSRT